MHNYTGWLVGASSCSFRTRMGELWSHLHKGYWAETVIQHRRIPSVPGDVFPANPRGAGRYHTRSAMPAHASWDSDECAVSTVHSGIMVHCDGTETTARDG